MNFYALHECGYFYPIRPIVHFRNDQIFIIKCDLKF